MNNQLIIVIIIIILLILIIQTKSFEFFDCVAFEKNLTNRIKNVQNPYDRIWPLTPRGITEKDCDLCVFKEKYESNQHSSYKYGDYIPRRIAKIIYPNISKNDYKNNNGCPPHSVYMNSCK